MEIRRPIEEPGSELVSGFGKDHYSDGMARAAGGSSMERRLILDYSYNRYLAVSARVVRRSLKDDKRLAAEKRGEMELRFAKWTVSFPPL
jgi:hypothetical protein